MTTTRVNHLKHIEIEDKKRAVIIDIISFLFGFSGSLLTYITSSYFQEAVGEEHIGSVFLLAYGAILVILLNFHKVIAISGKSFALNTSFILRIVTLVALGFLAVSFQGIIFFVLYIIFGVLTKVSLDAILESFSKDTSSGKTRGMHLAALETGFIAGPVISTQILKNYDFSGVFFVSLFIHVIIFIISLFIIRGTKHKFKEKISVLQLLKKSYGRRNILKIYCLSFVLEFFYAVMVIYTPIYLLGLGFSWEEIGIAFTIMLVPFVVLPYPLGVLADKITGEKELLIFSLFVMGISTIMVYFIQSDSVLMWAMILLLTRIGAATISALRDSYFYKRVDGTDVDLIDFFRTAQPVAFISASAVAFVLLTILGLPMETMFLAVVVVCVLGLVPAFKLVDNKSEREILNGN